MDRVNGRFFRPECKERTKMPAGPLLERDGGIDNKRRGSLYWDRRCYIRRPATSLGREVMRIWGTEESNF